MANRAQRAWPSSEQLSTKQHADDPEAWADRLPTPHVGIEGSRAKLWFGDAKRPLIELERISLP